MVNRFAYNLRWLANYSSYLLLLCKNYKWHNHSGKKGLPKVYTVNRAALLGQDPAANEE